jgi:hypothetical protein
MLTHSKTGPLKVALLSISPHNRAILEFFFAGAGKNLFKVVSIDDADALIVDYDHVGASDDWSRHAGGRRPGIILSVHAVDMPNTVWIPKPLTSRALTEAADKVHGLQAVATPAKPAASPIAARRENEARETSKPADVPSPRPLPGSFPPAFGMSTGSPRPARKLRSLVINLSDDDDEDEAEGEAAPVQPQVPVVPPVFDPAESEITMEEIARPVEPSMPPEVAERRWRELCGDHEDIDNPSDWHMEAFLFTPENYLLNNVLEAVRLARQSAQGVQLQFPAGGYVFLMPDTMQVYCSLDTRSDEFAMLCNNPVQTGQVTLHIPNTDELHGLEATARMHTDDILDMEGFVWVASLLTARGRLSRNVDVKQKVALKHWPNMTRLEQFPQLMRIAALWNQRPGNVFEIARALGVPQRYVFSFYTAASALNLFEMDQTKLKSREKEKPKESRGLFSRLLKRLLGGGSK